MAAPRAEVAAILAKVRDVFAADLRSLAALRIVLGLVVLLDLASRARDLTAHYTDDGVLPRAEALDRLGSKFSLNLISGDPMVQRLLFAVTALAAIALLVGWFTRLMTLIVWLMVVSTQWRNPLILGGGEALLRLLLFWGMFLPLGAVWSVDRLRRHDAPPLSMRYVSMPAAALFLQVAFVYWFAFLQKDGPEWRDGTALYYALNVEQLATPIGDAMSELPAGLLEVMTYGVLCLEALGPFLLFSPLLHGPLRTLAVGLFMSFHLGIWLTLGLGVFPAVAGLCMVCLLPTWFWDRLARRAPWARPPDPGGRPPAALTTPRALTVASAVLIVYVFAWNLTTVTSFRMPEALTRPGHLAALGQIWDMFAPRPLRDDGWYVIPGRLRDGRQVDVAGVLRGDEDLRPVSYRKPDDVRGTYKDERWRKYLEVLRTRDENRTQHRYLSRYVCREWNSHHGARLRLETLSIVNMGDTALPDGARTRPTLRTLWTARCA